jgi:NAD(P)-dependent dehydrogenase (short-subunit alcohol dehydrogenase family)
MDLKLQGKSALISGSTKGIGFATAALLAAEGARVIINGRTEAAVKDALDRIHAATPKAKLDGFAGDLSAAGPTAELVKRFPAVDILVNNLGIFERKVFEEIDDAEWQRFFDINVMSGVRLSRAYLAGMKQRGWGRIVFISSESGIQIPDNMIHYGMTKTAQLAIARGLAESVAGSKVTVNSILAGPTRSEGVTGFVGDLAKQKGVSEAQVEKEFFETVRPSSLIERFATTEEVASLVVYIASERSAATTGAALRVDGGVIRSIL